MNFEDRILKNDETAILKLRALYQRYGYVQYKMSKFEEYDLYVRNKDFLVSENIITFTDTNGKLLALKPDVTLSIVKNSQDKPGAVQKVYYNENVYRVSKGTHTFKEIMQTGLECVGDIDLYNICEVITLAANSLYMIHENYILDISHMGFVMGLLEELQLTGDQEKRILTCVGEKNIHEIEDLCAEWGIEEGLAKKLVTLVSSYGPMKEVLEQISAIIMNEKMEAAFAELNSIYEVMRANGYDGNMHFDFSIVNDMNYYNGVVFQGFIEGIQTGVLSGGRYDNLLQKMGKKSGAIGFAVYLDSLERLENREKQYDVDTVLLYDANEKVETVHQAVKQLADSGISVLALKELPEMITYRQWMKLTEGGLKSGGTND